MFGVKSLKLSLLLTWMLSSTGETRQFNRVKVGDDVTLTCEGYKEFNDKCKSITWMYSKKRKPTVTLFERGEVHRAAGSKSDRLSVTAECFLVIKKVRVEDDGDYTCRQFNSSGHKVTDTSALLSVTIKMKPNKTSSTNNPALPTTTTATAENPDLLPSLIGAAVGLAALLITTVMIIRWRKTKGRKTQMNDTTESNLNSAETRSGPETSRDMADHADIIHYASISNLNMTNTGVHSKDHEHRVTYSTVKARPAAATDPTDLYATIQ